MTSSVSEGGRLPASPADRASPAGSPARLEKIGVIGAGQMGSGIAHVCGVAGLDVVLLDVSTEQLQKAKALIARNLERQVRREKITAEQKAEALGHITLASDYTALGDRDLVVEAVTENEAVKREVFKTLLGYINERALIATNTSSISITEIAAATQRPEKVIGMHFMNPVPVMKLVEVIRGYDTTDAVTGTVVELSKAIGKVPVTVNDYAGFVANRILMPMINEAVQTLWQGVGGVEEIDTIMKLGMAHPMGPLQLADFIGLDTCVAILRVLHEGLGDPKYAPCPLLVQMVTAGKLGVKSGEGFYTYTAGSKDLVVSPAFRK